MLLRAWVIIVSTLFTPHTQVVDTTIANKVLNQSVLIRIKVFRLDEDLQRHYGMAGCSGTYITDNVVLTAAHCFSSGHTGIWVRGYNHKSSEAVLVKVDPEHDLALLGVLKPGKHGVAAMEQNLPRVGSKVVNVGSPMGFEFLLSEGIVALNTFKDKTFKSTYLISTAMINPGSSGGGAFNEKGDLIGVNTMSYGSPFGWSGISAAVDVQTIMRFLR